MPTGSTRLLELLRASPVTARTARRPRTWAGSGWTGTARPTAAKGKNDPEFRTKLQIGADLAVRVRAAGFAFRAVAADSAPDS
jgi:hypothetical protein